MFFNNEGLSAKNVPFETYHLLVSASDRDREIDRTAWPCEWIGDRANPNRDDFAEKRTEGSEADSEFGHLWAHLFRPEKCH